MKRGILIGVVGLVGLSCLCVLGWGGQNSTPLPKILLTLDFTTGIMSPFGTLKLSDGQDFEIEIVSLEPNYKKFDIQVTGIKSASLQGENPPSGKPEEKDIPSFVTIPIKHSSEYSSYQIIVKRKNPASDKDINSRTWVIPVFTHGWTLDFAGGFTADFLTSPVYYLEQTTYNNEAGNFIKENKDAEDLCTLGLVAMVHLYHTKIFGNPDKICWVPLTFGLGYSKSTDARYYFSPILGVCLGTKLFANVGVSLGAIDTLPGKYTKNAKSASGSTNMDLIFTTDKDPLSTLAKKTSWGIFVSLSYSFSSAAAKEKLQQPFTTGSK